ncbi:MAG: tRNA 2-selenouridine(34) synthase MnmH [Victivallales bacterium]|nr:tRNA 2-selenouridine(34) synthase MnmH [Victivallales bacterium]
MKIKQNSPAPDSNSVCDFHRLVTERVPLIDTRAPVEFSEGAFETATNLPLMNDEERRLVGIRYKNNGSNAAVELGHKLVCGELKESRIREWAKFIETHPECVIYCFRGGMRSQISQQWIRETTNSRIPRIDGGYKAFRRYLIDTLESIPAKLELLILAGRTGSGKTIILNEYQDAVDLEGLAGHRGSSFGRHATPQPTQINFENNLAFELINHLDAGRSRLLVEDESRNIGLRMITPVFFKRMKESAIVVLETPFPQRVDIIFDEYATAAQQEHVKLFGEEKALDLWHDAMSASLARITERLGKMWHNTILGSLNAAMNEQKMTGDAESHKEWMGMLLKKYYDPMYDYQIEKKKELIGFRGSPDEIRDYLTSNYKLSAIPNSQNSMI